MSVQTVFTIGVYGSTENDFFDKLVSNKIDLFIDIRRRRAVRGSKYAFVNSTHLQKKLRELDISYLHIIELAPTIEIRNLQKETDAKNNILKSQRLELSSEFINDYKSKVLDLYDLSKITQLDSAKNVVLFCVEKGHRACHRSIVADKINREFNLPIHNL